ncbi:MAG: acetoacetate--CoA ligase [Candidatus Pelagibacter sp.]|nr:acetoacetate--CoA ligase [Candidatus Pelagibacter sp.]|tara:strand:+ start:4443 stop:6398 length:1956 start_codon:yes stop_codon:yes gene_type:complete
MAKILWKATKKQIQKSNLLNYERFIKNNFNYIPKYQYNKLLEWTIRNPSKFWNSIWDYSEVIGDKRNKTLLNKNLFKSKFLVNSKLNFAENLLKKKNNDKAITFISENGFRCEKSWSEIYNSSSKIINFLLKNKVKIKDRVASYLPNIIETVECFLATSSLGAIWSSCSPDFGINGVIERFSQINPKILIIVDRYYYNGKEINVLSRLPKILNEIKSIKSVIVINYPGKKPLNLKKNLKVNQFRLVDILKNKPSKIFFKKFDFEHELAILFSSGTTGKPKCICHRAGGVLLQHLKEHLLHCEIKPNDNVFYFTTCGWMMWNWLISVLSTNASIVLFDGFPMFKKKDLLFDIAEKEKITLFGVSAKYIDTLNNFNINVKSKYKLKKLRTICSTGSPLSGNNYDYVYKKIKSNVHLASISGGTDIVSCFVLGNIYQPVIKGHIQNSGLGMDVDVFNNEGKPIKNEKGELVCKNAFPSMPIKFWNDKNYKKYKKTYFKKFKGIWHHGDFAEKKNNNNFIIYGRSDATLNPGGVRIGTAEIYSVLENFKEIFESIVIGQSWDNDVRIVLFVVLEKSSILSKQLKEKIKLQIKKLASPRHVPSKIIQVKDIPKTKNGKLVELSVKNIIEGKDIKNLQALLNPSVLNNFKNLDELKY